MKNTTLALVIIAFAATAFAATPGTTGTTDTVVTAPADALAPAADGGVYDSTALQCMEAEPEMAAGPQETRCWKCGDNSKGACGGGDKYCYGERSDCSKKGCRITGSTSKCTGNKKKNQC